MRFLDEAVQVNRGNAEDSIPRLVDLKAITAIARAYKQGKQASDEAMQALAEAGGSGGARPKANVRDGDDLWLAKNYFRSRAATDRAGRSSDATSCCRLRHPYARGASRVAQ